MEKTSSQGCHEYLQVDDSDTDSGEYQLNHGSIRRYSGRQKAFGFGIVLAILLYILVLLTVQVVFSRQGPSETTNGKQDWTLLSDRLQYEKRKDWIDSQHPWNLKPSDELDDAWEDLLYPQRFRITSSEMDAINENKTAKLRVGGGEYAATLGVYHHLHCLDFLRRLVHWDYYGLKPPTLLHSEGFSLEHADHCINALRQSLMCRPNTVAYTARWQDDLEEPIVDAIEADALSTCVKWDTIDGWARPRALVPGNYYYLPGPYKANRIAFPSPGV